MLYTPNTIGLLFLIFFLNKIAFKLIEQFLIIINKCFESHYVFSDMIVSHFTVTNGEKNTENWD